ncbi:MAG: DUF5320 domain-containing protein [Planctomycetes bacterium]|nr:DUF5320 domain-containing protein [Planctomycetota bacterium]
MPRGDGTGPGGMGPMTGRAAGFCAGYAVPGYANNVPGRGFGYGPGRGRGGGRGGGRGWRNMYYATGLPGWRRFGYGAGNLAPMENYPQSEPQSEMVYLQNQREYLQEQLDLLKERLEELDSRKAAEQ